MRPKRAPRRPPGAWRRCRRAGRSSPTRRSCTPRTCGAPATSRSLTFTHSNTEIGKVDSISTNLRFPIGSAWRLGPRFEVDRLSGTTDGSTSTTYIPSLLTEYQHGRGLFQLDAGAELGKREALLQLQSGGFVQTQNTTRYYVSVSYRIDFQR